jgi:hypothetical protein
MPGVLHNIFACRGAIDALQTLAADDRIHALRAYLK